MTVFTMYGPHTVSTDEKGVVVFADLPAEMTQWWARTAGLSNAEATRLKPAKCQPVATLPRGIDHYNHTVPARDDVEDR